MNSQPTLSDLREELKQLNKRSNIRELIFGAQDGLLVPLGVVSSVAGAFSNNHIVLVAGISEGLAGAFSMATGAYLAYQAAVAVEQSAAAQEEAKINDDPHSAEHQLSMLLEEENMTKDQAKTAAAAIAVSRKSLMHTLLQKKLDIDHDKPDNVMRDAMLIGLSYLLCSIVPLIPYFFISGASAIIASIASTLVALFIIGILKGYFTTKRYLINGLQVLLIGSISGLGGYLIGRLLPGMLGL